MGSHPAGGRERQGFEYFACEGSISIARTPSLVGERKVFPALGAGHLENATKHRLAMPCPLFAFFLGLLPL